jgi:RNA polymerase sigma-70 factor (ECF subfamily)
VSNPPASDQQLLERLRAGDEQAFELLFRSYYPGLLRFAHAHLGDRGEAEDVVHDVFLRVWRERERVGGDRSLRVYLLASVRNRVIDVVRHRAVRRRWVQEDAGEREDGGGGMLGVRAPALASEGVELGELDAAIRQAVAALPERCRTAFLLCKEQELTYAQAAEVMGVSPATVKTQIARALAALRVSLEPFLTVLVAAAAALHR